MVYYPLTLSTASTVASWALSSLAISSLRATLRGVSPICNYRDRVVENLKLELVITTVQHNETLKLPKH